MGIDIQADISLSSNEVSGNLSTNPINISGSFDIGGFRSWGQIQGNIFDQTDLSGYLHDDVTVTDSDEIDFTLSNQNITAELKTGSISGSKLTSAVQDSLSNADTAFGWGDHGNEGYLKDTTWVYLVNSWTGEPTLAKTIASGEVYEYPYSFGTYYRFVPSTYNSTQDAFYSGFDDGNDSFSNLISIRGVL